MELVFNFDSVAVSYAINRSIRVSSNNEIIQVVFFFFLFDYTRGKCLSSLGKDVDSINELFAHDATKMDSGSN